MIDFRRVFASFFQKFALAITMIALMFLVVQDANAQIGGGLRDRAKGAAQGVGKGASGAAKDAAKEAKDDARKAAEKALDDAENAISGGATGGAPASTPSATSAPASTSTDAPATTAPASTGTTAPASTSTPSATTAPASGSGSASGGTQDWRARPASEVWAFVNEQFAAAKKATNYDEKNEAYSRNLLTIGMYGNIGTLKCDEPKMRQAEADMKALEEELWLMYDALVAARQRPKNSPSEFKTCDENLASRAAYRTGVNMPKTYKVAPNIEKLIKDLFNASPYKRGVEQLGTIVDFVILSNDWKETIIRDQKYPYKVVVHFRAWSAGVVVKVEDYYRLYTMFAQETPDLSGNWRGNYTLQGNVTKNLNANFIWVNYKK